MTNVRCLMYLVTGAAFAMAACGGAADETETSAGESAEPAETTAEAPEGHEAMGGASTALMYECAEGGFTLMLLDGASRARIELDDGTHDLEASPSDDGMGYVGDGIEFMGRGTAATVSLGGETVYTECEASGHTAE